MKKSTDKWYIKVFEPIEHPDGGFIANYKIHWLYRLFMWFGLADKPIIKPLDLFTRQTKNPYTLHWYKNGWGMAKTEKNNDRYWHWEIKYNGFKPPHLSEKTINELKQKPIK